MCDIKAPEIDNNLVWQSAKKNSSVIEKLIFKNVRASRCIQVHTVKRPKFDSLFGENIFFLLILFS
jgi:hypothetical protein